MPLIFCASWDATAAPCASVSPGSRGERQDTEPKEEHPGEASARGVETLAPALPVGSGLGRACRREAGSSSCPCRAVEGQRDKEGEETKVPGRKFGAVAGVQWNTNEEASELQPHLSYYVMAYFSALHLFGDCSQAGSSPAATKSKSTEINLALTD